MSRIRSATAGDFRAVQSIYQQSIMDADWLPPTDRSNADFAMAMACDGEKIFVSTNNCGDIAGFISIWEDGSFIHHLYVSSANQRSGIGTSLLKSLISWLPKPWNLKCVVGNTKAMEFYKHQGFVTVSTHDDANPPYALLRSEA